MNSEHAQAVQKLQQLAGAYNKNIYKCMRHHLSLFMTMRHLELYSTSTTAKISKKLSHNRTLSLSNPDTVLTIHV